MSDESIKVFLEALDETCFPAEIDWNNLDLYVSGVKAALKKSNLTLIENDE